MKLFERAQELLNEFKDGQYHFGEGIIAHFGHVIANAGKTAVMVRGTFPGSDAYVEQIINSYQKEGGRWSAVLKGVRPNAPREDVFRLANELRSANADVLVSFGGGSTIDAAKAAEVLNLLDGEIDAFFGTGQVSNAIQDQKRHLKPHAAIQTAASSAAHLTKYSNITDLSTQQKKLIVDDAIVPALPMFDYSVNQSSPPSLKTDGAMDGISHCLEVLYGAAGKPGYERIEDIAVTGIGLAVNYLARALQDPNDHEANRALCLATDLGGYAIMVGGTNGGHLTSFSLVDILNHGRACAILNPYYTVFFAPAIERPLKAVGKVYQAAGFTSADIDSLNGRSLGEAVAEAMFNLAGSIGFPTRLDEVQGFGNAHIERALSAAKDPQLKMKLENMPVPLKAENVDETMKPILEAAKTGDLSRIRNV